jgi:hypothetical protein
MSFNPSKYKIAEEGTCEIPDAKGEVILLDNGQPWTITVASPGTKEAMRALHEYQKAQKSEVFSQMAGKKSTRDEMDEIKDRAKFLMAITRGTNAEGLEYEGKTGNEALRAIYMDPLMGHVAAAVDKYHTDRGNFYAG